MHLNSHTFLVNEITNSNPHCLIHTLMTHPFILTNPFHAHNPQKVSTSPHLGRQSGESCHTSWVIFGKLLPLEANPPISVTLCPFPGCHGLSANDSFCSTLLLHLSAVLTNQSNQKSTAESFLDCPLWPLAADKH